MNYHGLSKHIVGLFLSVLFTLFSLFIVLDTSLPITYKLLAIGVFAVLQAFVQLILFMHITEKDSNNESMYHKWMLWAGFAIVIIIIGGSIWIMAFSAQVS